MLVSTSPSNVFPEKCIRTWLSSTVLDADFFLNQFNIYYSYVFHVYLPNNIFPSFFYFESDSMRGKLMLFQARVQLVLFFWEFLLSMSHVHCVLCSVAKFEEIPDGPVEILWSYLPHEQICASTILEKRYASAAVRIAVEQIVFAPAYW